MVLRESAWLVLGGMTRPGCGDAAARLVESQLFALKATDPLTLALRARCRLRGAAA